MHYMSLKSPSKRTPPYSPTGPMERAARIQEFFLHISQIPYKIPINKNFIPSLKGPRKASFHFPQKQDPCGNRRPFPEPYVAYIRDHQ